MWVLDDVAMLSVNEVHRNLVHCKNKARTSERTLVMESNTRFGLAAGIAALLVIAVAAPTAAPPPPDDGGGGGGPIIERPTTTRPHPTTTTTPRVLETLAVTTDSV